MPLFYLFTPETTGWDIGLLIGFIVLFIIVGLVYAYLVRLMIIADVEDEPPKNRRKNDADTTET